MNSGESSSTDGVVVIGGAGGIGSAIVKKFIGTDHFVIVGDVDPEGLAELDSQFESSILCLPLDVTREESVQQFVGILKSRDFQIMHLVETAGIALPGEWKGVRRTPFSTFSDSIDLNLKAHIRITQELLPLFVSHVNINRSITYLSSINALVDYGGPGYSAAKAGILGFVRSCTSELGKDGIRVNAVLPGTVPTPNTTVHRNDMDVMLEKTALGRLTTPEEIAEVVHALAVQFTCVTGEFLVADCGQSVKF